MDPGAGQGQGEGAGPDYYSVLGCPASATEDQLRAEYRARARQLHPDSGGHTRDFQKLQEAKETLLNRATRKLYDKWKSSGIDVSYKQWETWKDRSVYIQAQWMSNVVMLSQCADQPALGHPQAREDAARRGGQSGGQHRPGPGGGRGGAGGAPPPPPARGEARPAAEAGLLPPHHRHDQQAGGPQEEVQKLRDINNKHCVTITF